MFHIDINVEDKKYCGKFTIEDTNEAACKIINNIDVGCGVNDIQNELSRMKKGEIAGFCDFMNGREAAWVTKLS